MQSPIYHFSRLSFSSDIIISNTFSSLFLWISTYIDTPIFCRHLLLRFLYPEKSDKKNDKFEVGFHMDAQESELIMQLLQVALKEP